MSKLVSQCAYRACAECPWRKSNKGKPSPPFEGKRYGWYSQQNQKRLWSQLRNGEAMTCHPTDHTNPADLNGKKAEERIQTRECAGAIILVQREMTIAQEKADKQFRRYRREHPKGLTLTGIMVVVGRMLFPFGTRMGRPNLNDLDVQYEPLGEWRARIEKQKKGKRHG